MSLVKVFEIPTYELYVDRRVQDNGLVSVEVFSVWPKTRNKANSVPHRLLCLNIPPEAVDALADAIKGV